MVTKQNKPPLCERTLKAVAERLRSTTNGTFDFVPPSLIRDKTGEWIRRETAIRLVESMIGEDGRASPGIEHLEAIEADQNQGRGVQCVKDIITYLKRNDIESAKSTIQSEWDKISAYPTICKWFKDAGLAEKHWYEAS